MNFKENKKRTLESLSKLMREKQNARKASIKRLQKEVGSNNSVESSGDKDKPGIIVFGQNSFFLKRLIESLKSTYTVTHFDDIEEACDYCTSHTVSYILLDMDPPTDWKQSTDLFTNTKMVNPNTLIFLATGNKNWVPVGTLVHQGGILVEKPVNLNDISDYITN